MGQNRFMNQTLYDMILPGFSSNSFIDSGLEDSSSSASTRAGKPAKNDPQSSMPRDPLGMVAFDTTSGLIVPSNVLHDSKEPFMSQVIHTFGCGSN